MRKDNNEELVQVKGQLSKEEMDDDDSIDAESPITTSTTSEMPLTLDPAAYDSAILLTMRPLIRNMIDVITRSRTFNSVLDNQLSGLREHPSHTAASSAANSTTRLVDSGPQSGINTRSSRKRQKQGSGPNPPGGGDDGDDSDDSDERRDKDRKKGRCTPHQWSRKPGKLACPYYKFDPERFHTDRLCGKIGWETTHRVK
jgi:hypothetical protein